MKPRVEFVRENSDVRRLAYKLYIGLSMESEAKIRNSILFKTS